MEHRHVIALAEGQSVEFVADGEDAFGDVIDREVGFGVLLGEVVLFGADLVGVVPPVPRFGTEIAAFPVDVGLDLGEFFLGLFQGGLPHLVHQLVSCLGGLGHVLVQHVGSPVVKAQQLGFFHPEVDHRVDDRFVVGVVVAVAALYVAFDHLFPQVAAGGVGNEGNPAGFLHRNHVAFLAQSLGIGGHRGFYGFRQAVEVVFTQADDDVVGLLEHVVAEGERKGGQSGVDLAQAGFLVLGQVDAGTLEAFVQFFRQAGFLTRQTERIAVVVHVFDALEQTLVEGDVVVVGGEQRGNFLGNGIQSVVGIGFGDVEEDHRYPGEQVAGVFVGQHRIFKGGRFGVGHDRVDLGTVLLDAFQESRLVVFVGDPVEGRYLVRSVVRGEKWIHVFLLFGRAARQQSADGRCDEDSFSFHISVFFVCCIYNSFSRRAPRCVRSVQKPTGRNPRAE